jgi:phosphatidylinositol glycan class B
MSLVGCLPQFRAMILSVLPNLLQALFASGMDYHTWQLAEKIYGKGSKAGWATVSKPIPLIRCGSDRE